MLKYGILKCGLAYANIDPEEDCKYCTVIGNKLVNYNRDLLSGTDVRFTREILTT